MSMLKSIHIADDLDDLIMLHVDLDDGRVEPVYPADAFADNDDEEFAPFERAYADHLLRILGS